MDYAWVNIWSKPLGLRAPLASTPNFELTVPGRYPGTGLYPTRDDAVKAAKSPAAEAEARAEGSRYLGSVRVDMQGLPK